MILDIYVDKNAVKNASKAAAKESEEEKKKIDLQGKVIAKNLFNVESKEIKAEF